MPRQFVNQGDKLAFSNGISGAGGGGRGADHHLDGDPHLPIPLYMIGVFMSFTLNRRPGSLRWRRLRTLSWQDQRDHQRHQPP